MLAERLFGGSSEVMDYNLVATTVFTPIEYSACGLAEEDAMALWGEDKLEVYHSAFKPLEWVFDQESEPDSCYCKVVVAKESGKVLGIHYVGPQAGEVMQGYAVAMKCGVTWAQFKATVGIHPTCAEEMVVMSKKKSEGGDAQKDGC